MGTYIRELTGALAAYTDINLHVVNYHSEKYSEFSIKRVSSRFITINIPSPKQSCFNKNQFDEKYATALVYLLSGIIPKNGEIIFQMNFVDDLPIIKKIKNKYSYPILNIAHSAQWQDLFKGNRQKLKGLNINSPRNYIELLLSREKEMYQLSDHIVSVCQYMKDVLVEEYGIPPDKIDVIPNGYDYTKINTITNEEKVKLKHKLGFDVNEKIILFSGRIEKLKGIFFLIDAFIQACEYSDDLRLVIVGHGDFEECLKKYNSFYGKITYTGFLSLEQLMSFYQIADIGIIPSFFEQCPYSVLEMVSFNIPIILSRVDGLKEMLTDNQCIFINPIISNTGEIYFDEQEIVDAILSLTKSKKKMKRITRDYKDLSCTKFSTQRMAKDILSVITKLNTVSVESF